MADFDFPAGKIIFKQGDPSDRAYLIVSGKVEVLRIRSDGSEEHLAFLSSGQLVGEYGVMDDAPRSATIRAVEPTRLRNMYIERGEE